MTRDEVQHLKSILDSFIEPHLAARPIFGADGEIVDFECTDANAAACARFHRRESEIVGLRTSDLLPSLLGSPLMRAWCDVVETGVPFIADDLPVFSDALGEERWFDTRIVKVGDHITYTWRDCTERHQNAAKLAESERRYRLLADHAMDLVLTTDRAGRVTWASPSVCTLLGLDAEEVEGLAAADLFVEQDWVPPWQVGAPAPASGASGVFRARMKDSSGWHRWMEIRSRPWSEDGDQVSGQVFSARDVDAEVRAQTALELELEYDALTGLAKRSLALERMDRMRARASRRDWAVLYVGVHGMTAVNQAYGYAAGDLILREVARRLVRSAGMHDRVARITGDEFVVLVREATTPQQVEDAAQRLIHDVRGPVPLGDGREVPLSVSAGIALADRTTDPEALLRDAHAAMQRAKRRGGDSWAFLTEDIAATSRDELDVRRGIEQALATQRVVAWAMPIADLTTGSIRGYEALVRLLAPDGAILTPDRFLPVAERTSLIHEIDRVVLSQSFDLLVRLPEPLHVAVNVSGSTLASGHLVEWVEDQLERAGTDPSRLHLEVTETALFELSEEVQRDICRLDTRGVRWWVDDFGTGYSSISHLRDLAIHGLKLDRSFTSGLVDGDESAQRLAHGLAGLAAGLGLATVAEGIEDALSASMLRDQGWQMGQGWHYGRPAPADVILEEWRADRHTAAAPALDRLPGQRDRNPRMSAPTA
jgi:diguanylate cyclase (GGDEF)-like protein/PAS domain S-box-containing protein